jgi:hypothetical protein
MYMTIAVILFNVCVMAVDFDCDFDALPEAKYTFLKKNSIYFRAYILIFVGK